MTLLHERIPVLIFERVKTKQYLRIFKRYRRKPLFLGKMDVRGILLMGLSGYRYFMLSRYDSTIHAGLMSLLSSAKIDLTQYRIVNWFQQNGRFIILLTRELTQHKTNSSQSL